MRLPGWWPEAEWWWKFFTLNSTATRVGEYVEAGQPIGQVQAVSTRYPNEGMTDHVHVEAKVDGVLMNPTKLLPGL